MKVYVAIIGFENQGQARIAGVGDTREKAAELAGFMVADALAKSPSDQILGVRIDEAEFAHVCTSDLEGAEFSALLEDDPPDIAGDLG